MTISETSIIGGVAQWLGRRSPAGRLSFMPDLWFTWATSWIRCPLSPTRPTQPSMPSGSVN